MPQSDEMISNTRESAILQVRNIKAIFPNKNGGLTALEDVSFSIEPQKFVCILGQSGSGKSTLLRIIAGLLQPTSGEVLFENSQVESPSRKIGVVFQDANLMPWRSVLENITLPLELEKIDKQDAQRQALDLVKLIKLDGFENWLPRDLSGGMSQRVAIARALINQPDVLLLDEPFGSLDALTRERMAMELMHIWQVNRKTVIMVTHSISESLMLADRILVLSSRPGKINLDLNVDLPRPRHEKLRYTSDFISMARQLRNAITESI